MFSRRVIALKSRNRLDSFFSRSASQGFEVHWGVDGAVEETESRFDMDRARRHYGSDLKPGQVGCSLSHAQLWQEFAQGPGDDREIMVVAEDDALLTDHFMQVVSKVAMLPDVECVNLSHASAGARTPDARSQTEQQRQISLLSRAIVSKAPRSTKVFRVGPYAGVMWGTGLYLVTRGAARKFAAYLDSTPRIWWLADDFNQFAYLMNIDCRAIKPGLCDWSGDSVIHDSGNEFMSTLHSVPGKGLRVALAPRARMRKAALVGAATFQHLEKMRSRSVAR